MGRVNDKEQRVGARGLLEPDTDDNGDKKKRPDGRNGVIVAGRDRQEFNDVPSAYIRRRALLLAQ